MYVPKDILAECKKEGVVKNLAKVKEFIKSNHEYFHSVIKYDDIDKQPMKQRRNYMFDRVCPVLLKDTKKVEEGIVAQKRKHGNVEWSKEDTDLLKTLDSLKNVSIYAKDILNEKDEKKKHDKLQVYKETILEMKTPNIKKPIKKQDNVKWSNEDIELLEKLKLVNNSPYAKAILDEKDDKMKHTIMQQYKQGIQYKQDMEGLNKKLAATVIPTKPFKKKKTVEIEVDARGLTFNIEVQPATQEYLKAVKKEVDESETANYSIDSFEKDITNDDFVKKAVAAHEAALRFKIKTYEKLAKIDWNTEDSGGSKTTLDMNKTISTMVTKLKIDLNAYIAMPMKTRLDSKRYQLESILFDEDNGIDTIKGRSRANVRIMLIKIIYMFLQVPEFFYKGFINFIVTGPAGSGKTKTAGVIAHMFSTLGILASNKVVFATKQNLVGQYLGQSGPKTRMLLSTSLEGVVFIDEAYTLTPCPGEKTNSDFSNEAVGELINFMDKFAGCFVVIVAGYKNKMYDCFMTFNEGIARRFPKAVDFVPYENKDMFDILVKFISDSVDIKIFKKEHLALVKYMIYDLNAKEVFSNQAGDMLNFASMLSEDAMLAGEKFSPKHIVLSFKKFLASKNVAFALSEDV
jgi:hypothetical protein